MKSTPCLYTKANSKCSNLLRKAVESCTFPLYFLKRCVVLTYEEQNRSCQGTGMTGQASGISIFCKGICAHLMHLTLSLQSGIPHARREELPCQHRTQTLGSYPSNGMWSSYLHEQDEN